jgi:hypothetical protein
MLAKPLASFFMCHSPKILMQNSIKFSRVSVVSFLQSEFSRCDPCLSLTISSGLMEGVEGTIVRDKPAANGEGALGHMRELEVMRGGGEIA